ncbi:hypothetical protein [Thiothrix subterranea]|uniref:Uncharacterized protein n=1 Tax=Thiothrix subterranea TaxID=2735563 RepID=A0AA51R4B5_9GAMM|nr:hypothetical protein [Thiothrix subterranea]MDQ5768823.1 hypothetical protein [Thiothrix subterranea]WML86496.1 hypothetical protein RCG00_19705 [Thiothrix subterranea]
MFKKVIIIFFLIFSLSQTASARDNYCHGALGMQCGEITLAQVAACGKILGGPYAVCMINAGSWRHDKCCAQQSANNPGMMCNGGSESSTQCQSEWNTAVTRFTEGYNWSRIVDTRINDTTPRTIDRKRFCGKPGARFHALDTDNPFCCSRDSRGPNLFEALLHPQSRFCL